jgi:hypothetical protein
MFGVNIKLFLSNERTQFMRNVNEEYGLAYQSVYVTITHSA